MTAFCEANKQLDKENRGKQKEIVKHSLKTKSHIRTSSIILFCASTLIYLYMFSEIELPSSAEDSHILNKAAELIILISLIVFTYFHFSPGIKKFWNNRHEAFKDNILDN